MKARINWVVLLAAFLTYCLLDNLFNYFEDRRKKKPKVRWLNHARRQT